MSDLTIPGIDRATANQFDAIRQTRTNGTEYWSARDLAKAVNYESWRNFASAIERARIAATNTGADAASAFVQVSEVVNAGNLGPQEREDFELSRFGAYLTVMNGDPRKPAIAEAQAYFAIQTRVAETAPAVPALKGAELLAHAVLEAQQMLAAKDAHIAVLEPKAVVADKILDASGDWSVADAAKVLKRGGLKLGERRLFETLASVYKWIYRDRADGRWRIYQTAIERGYMLPLPKSHYHPTTGELVLDPPQPRVTAKGVQKILTDNNRGGQLALEGVSA